MEGKTAGSTPPGPKVGLLNAAEVLETVCLFVGPRRADAGLQQPAGAALGDILAAFVLFRLASGEKEEL